MKNRTMATKAQGSTCDNCIPVWDRTGNVKAIQLCALHDATNDLLDALKLIVLHDEEAGSTTWLNSMERDAAVKAIKKALGA